MMFGSSLRWCSGGDGALLLVLGGVVFGFQFNLERPEKSEAIWNCAPEVDHRIKELDHGRNTHNTRPQHYLP
jgi:hypothetical protein